MKKYKGFTLIELLVVMAILAILMTGIVALIKPIRTTYVDTTYYESVRTSQSGIAQYIAESTRYAKLISLYNDGTLNYNQMVADFETKAIAAGFPNTAATWQRVEVLVIDNSTLHTFSGKDYKGRLVRKESGVVPTGWSLTDLGPTGEARIAMGPAYYGRHDYRIKLLGVTALPDPPALNIEVSTFMGASPIKTKAGVAYLNLDPAVKGAPAGTPEAGSSSEIDVSRFDETMQDAISTKSPTYIFFINPKS